MNTLLIIYVRTFLRSWNGNKFKKQTEDTEQTSSLWATSVYMWTVLYIHMIELSLTLFMLVGFK